MSGPGEILDLIAGVLGEWDDYDEDAGAHYTGPTAMRWAPPDTHAEPRTVDEVTTRQYAAAGVTAPIDYQRTFQPFVYERRTDDAELEPRLTPAAIYAVIERLASWIPDRDLWEGGMDARRRAEDAAEVTRRLRAIESGRPWGSPETLRAVDAARVAATVPHGLLLAHGTASGEVARELGLRLAEWVRVEMGQVELRVVDHGFDGDVTVVAEATGLLRFFPIPTLDVIRATTAT